MLIAQLAVDAILKKSIEKLSNIGLNKICIKATSIDANNKTLCEKYRKRRVFINTTNVKMDSDCASSTTITLSDNASTNGSDSVSSPSTKQQTDSAIIMFKASDKQCCHEINASNITVVISAGNHDHGSSKVKLKNIVDYKWEAKNYPARLIAVHLNERYVAYVINVNKVTRMEGMVRVANTKNGLRTLIKGMFGEVLDLQFAHIESEHILACIDVNSLYIHKIDECDDSLFYNLIIKVESPLNNYTSKYDRISWCPFIEQPGEDTEENQLLVWSRGSVFQCFNINTIVAEHGIGQLLEKEIKEGYIKHEDESITITWIGLSPDGSTLGAGCTDGVIRFYQVYMHEKSSRCLHQWKPHNGKPISSFFFLDNLTKNNTETYWKAAITAAVNNTEFKVWDCGSWSCIQTINMVSANKDNKNLHFLAEIDRTSSYLVLSNLEARACYVMQINNDSSGNASGISADVDCGSSKDFISNKDNYKSLIASNKDIRKSSGASVLSNASSLTVKSTTFDESSNLPSIVCIKSVAEFPLNSAILSFSIIDAGIRRYKCANDDYLCEELDYYDEETHSVHCVVIRMYIIQSKSMQKCHILYQPMTQENVEFKSTIVNSTPGSEHNIQLNKSLSLTMSHNQSLNVSHNQINNIENNDNEKVNKFDVLLNITSVMDDNDDISSGKQKTAVITDHSINLIRGHMPSHDAIDTAAVAESAAASQTSTDTVNVNTKSFNQLNLMTPEAFTSTASEGKTPVNVSTDVLNTILMLAGVTGSGPKCDNTGILKLTKNAITESHMEQQQQHESQTNFIAIDRNPSRGIIDNITSGGSSPSREVQEIMSLQDYDKSPFSGDELSDEDNSMQKKPEMHSINGVAFNILKAGQATVSNWSKMTPETMTAAKHSTELQNAANLISQAVTANCSTSLSSNIHHNLTNDSASLVDGLTKQSQPPSNFCHSNNSNNGEISTTIRGNPDLSEINTKINELIDLVKMQSIQLNSLQNEFNDLKNTKAVAAGTSDLANTHNNSNSNSNNSNNKDTHRNSTADLTNKLEIHVTKLMEQCLKRQENDFKRKCSNFIAEKDIKNQELIDNILKIMNKYILSQLNEIISKVMSHEIQRQVAPLLSNKLDTFQHQLQLDVAKKLSTYDEMLKENLAEACKSKNILEAFGKSVLMGVQGSLQAAFIESMSSTLIPAYEKSSQNMFQQLHDAFSVGIKEFIEQYNNYLQQLQPMQDSTEDILRKFSGFHDNLESLLTQHRTVIQDALLETRKDIKTMEVSLSQQLQAIIRSEVRKSFDDQTTVLRSQTNTPAPVYGAKDAIKVLLMQGKINKAFHQALLANDLALVEFTLKSTDRYAVFTPTCCLEQKVLLSLIQQISADMTNHNDLKHSYLCEALLAINHEDSIIREHAPKVIKELYCNCQLFLVSFPRSQQCSNVRILMKAVQTILEKL